MRITLPGLALATSALALGLSSYTLLREPNTTQEADWRLETLERQLSRLDRTQEEEEALRERAPTLLGLSVPSGSPRAPGASADTANMAAGFDAPDAHNLATPAGTEASPDELTDLVDKAVERKAMQLQAMRDKKPAIDLLAKVLELTPEQRELAEQQVLRGQHEIQAILEEPSEDGTHFLEELVEVMAAGMARPGEDKGRGAQLMSRLLAERPAGSNETYAARVETVKASVREAYRRSWTPKQFALFETWQMDPTDVKGIPGSPWKALEVRVIERARQLGAEIPASK